VLILKKVRKILLFNYIVLQVSRYNVHNEMLMIKLYCF